LQEEKELGNSIKHQNLLGWTGVQNIWIDEAVSVLSSEQDTGSDMSEENDMSEKSNFIHNRCSRLKS
jgi:hypothetical protein